MRTPRATGALGAIHPLLRAASVAGFLLTAGALLVRPDATLRLVWHLVVPLLPVSFLVSPEIWRAVCPLATLGMAGNRVANRRLSARVSRLAGASGIVALFVLVPARHFLFNGSGSALVTLLAAAAVLATSLGFAYRAKAGFCNTLCPVLPVERLYGQRPFLRVGNPRCAVCDLCTPRGCIDLAAEKSIVQLLGPARRGSAWLRTAFGAFAAAFPGFIVGYFTADATAVLTADPTAPRVFALYAYVLGCAAGSYLAVCVVVLATRTASGLAMSLLATLSAGLYYWFVIPRAAVQWGIGPVAAEATRGVLLAVVLAWGVRAVRRRSPAERVDQSS